jgi:DnaJ-class molecular chaperone
MTISCYIMGLLSPELKQCPVCNGTGKVVTGYGVICMEIVEKVEKCPSCRGNAVLGCDKCNLTLSKKLIKV